VAARESDGAFASLWDFAERVDPQLVNKRSLESLVKAGALDSTGSSRKGMLDVLEHALSYGQTKQADRAAGQASIFDDLAGADTPEATPHPEISVDEFDKPELLRLEKETLGLYVSEHPLHAIRDQLRRKTDSSVADLERRRDGEVVTVGGIVSSVKHLTTKKGDPMVFLSLGDLSGEAEVVVFNSVFAAARELCQADTVLVVKGRVDHKQEGETKLIALEVTAFEAARVPTEVRLRVDARAASAGIVRELGHVVKDFPGEARVVVALETSEGPRTLELGPDYRVRPEADFFAEVKALLGEAAVM
jgi:DNA polymerase-3 subunit alpha